MFHNCDGKFIHRKIHDQKLQNFTSNLNTLSTRFTLLHKPSIMNATTQITPKTNLTIPATVSFLITTFLFYIDEGYYNFKWVLDPGNLFVFVIYFSGLLFGQLFVSVIILRKLFGTTKHVINGLVGIPLGIVFTLFMLFCLRLFLNFMTTL